MKIKTYLLSLCTSGIIMSSILPVYLQAKEEMITVGPRAYYLINKMKDSELKRKLQSCMHKPMKSTLFSIGHRGAAMQFPEHTKESYLAAHHMGAGIIECDVTFTKDKQLVCRHAQNDLHTTTNILATTLAKKCTQNFIAAKKEQDAKAECRTSDITLKEFLSLDGKMDAANKKATNLSEYMNATAKWRTDLYSMEDATLMSHAQSIQLIKKLGGKFTPEIKAPSVTMPFKGFSQNDYVQKVVDEYKEAGVSSKDVWIQSFNLLDILYLIKNEPKFGKQAVYLDGRYDMDNFDPNKPSTFKPSMKELKAKGVNYIAPPTWMLVTLKKGKIVPSQYAKKAKKAGLKIITWTLERSGPLVRGGGWYYQSIKEVTNSDGVMYELLDVLAKDVGVVGVFSDWPATVSYYANCMGLK